MDSKPNSFSYLVFCQNAHRSIVTKGIAFEKSVYVYKFCMKAFLFREHKLKHHRFKSCNTSRREFLNAIMKNSRHLIILPFCSKVCSFNSDFERNKRLEFCGENWLQWVRDHMAMIEFQALMHTCGVNTKIFFFSFVLPKVLTIKKCIRHWMISLGCPINPLHMNMFPALCTSCNSRLSSCNSQVE